MALSKIFNDSILFSKSSICFYKILSFIPVFGSKSEDGFLRRSSAFEYSVQIWARNDALLALATTPTAPSLRLIMPCFTAILPHSASLSSYNGRIFAV
jgi:hypothetical protein